MAFALRRTGLAPPIYSNHQDYAVIDGGREVGRIYGDRTPAAADAAWFWSIIVIGARHAGIKTDGRAATFYDAKAQFQDNYRKWLAWAKLEEPKLSRQPAGAPPSLGVKTFRAQPSPAGLSPVRPVVAAPEARIPSVSPAGARRRDFPDSPPQTRPAGEPLSIITFCEYAERLRNNPEQQTRTVIAASSLF
jgi:hypothetical protein